jgi:hypothetical protein
MLAGDGTVVTRGRELLVACSAVVMAMCFVLGTPRSGGPDEPAHAVASAALIRGDRAVVFSASETPLEQYTLPGMIGRPDPSCFAFQPEVPAACAGIGILTTEPGSVTSSAGAYPIWGHLAPGLASFVPWAGGYLHLARLFNLAIPLLLVIASLVTLRRLGAAPAVAALLGFAPIAWFSLGVVNPSAQAIAGGLALWVGLLTRARSQPLGWLAVAGWAALVLTRREGGLWASIIVVLVCVATDQRPSELWARLSPGRRSVVVLSVVLQVLARLGGHVGAVDTVMAAATLLVVIAEPLLLWLRAPSTTARPRRSVAFAVGGALLVGVLVALVLDRAIDGGLRLSAVKGVLGGTGEHLRQLVGVMGWVDAPTPGPAVVMWWVMVGVVFALPLMLRPRVAVVTLAGFIAALATAWVLELGAAGVGWTGAWQGRYSLPLTVGLPVLAVVAAGAVSSSRAITVTVAAGVVVVLNLAFANTQRRWGVGASGSMLPWDWDTWGAPVSPAALLCAHLAASIALVAACVGGGGGQTDSTTSARTV